MRKGMMTTIAINTLVQFSALVLITIGISLHGYIMQNDRAEFSDIFLLMICIATTLSSIIFQGFYFKKKYNEAVNYWKYILITLPISILASSLFYFAGTLYRYIQIMVYTKNVNVSISLWEDLKKNAFMIPVLVGIFLVENIITGLFLKHMKMKKETDRNNEGNLLDSDILND